MAHPSQPLARMLGECWIHMNHSFADSLAALSPNEWLARRSRQRGIRADAQRRSKRGGGMNDASAPRMLAPGAFGDLLNRYQWPLYSFLRGFISDAEQARDIVQDVFCDAWRVSQRGVAPFDGQEGAEEGIRRWLFNAAYWRAISALRRRRLIRWES